MPFDELLAEVDRLAGTGFFAEDIVCQSGQSGYAMAHAGHFSGIGIGEFAELIARSSLVISHGGATVVQLLLVRKPFVAFPNPRGADDHQASFLRQVAAVADISWSPHVTDLPTLVRERRIKGPAGVQLDFPRLHTEILRFIS